MAHTKGGGVRRKRMDKDKVELVREISSKTNPILNGVKGRRPTFPQPLWHRTSKRSSLSSRKQIIISKSKRKTNFIHHTLLYIERKVGTEF